MATAEASPSTLGPRYAPDDPTLPEPWKGLIDGSTGLLYYWNPETNVTQYEKPASLPPPLPPGPPPAASAPKLNPIPASRASQPENIQTMQNQQMMQTQVQGSHLGTTMQQGHFPPEQMRPQMMQQPGHQLPSQLAQMPVQPGQQGLPQSMQQGPMHQGQQASYQSMQLGPQVPQGQMYPGAQMGTSHGFQFNPQHTQYMSHQQNVPLQGMESSSRQFQPLIQGQQLPHKQEHKMEPVQRDDIEFHQGKQAGFSPANQHLMQGQHLPHLREQKSGIPHKDDADFQQVNQAGFSPAQIQQTGTSMQNLPMGTNSSHAQKMSIQPNQTMQYGGSSANMQQNNPPVQLQQMGAELAHPQHGSRFQNQMGPVKHGQQQNILPGGSKMPYEENHLGRPGNEYLYNTSNDVSAVPPQLPKLAPLPMTRNQQEMRIGDFPPQTVTPTLPGRLNGPGVSPLHGVYGHSSSAPPYPNNAFVRPPSGMMGPSDPIHLSAAEVYRQKHEVTATVRSSKKSFVSNFVRTANFPRIEIERSYVLSV